MHVLVRTTPKALAKGLRRRRWLTAAQWLERSDNPAEMDTRVGFNAESVGEDRRGFANTFSVGTERLYLDPGLYQPWAEIGERLRR